MLKETVLIVDDDLALRSAVERGVSQMPGGKKAVVVSDGQTGVDTITQDYAELIAVCTDLDLGTGLNGNDVAWTAVGVPGKRPKIPHIFIHTAQPEGVDRELLAYGIQVFSKPSQSVALIQALRALRDTISP